VDVIVKVKKTKWGVQKFCSFLELTPSSV